MISPSSNSQYTAKGGRLVDVRPLSALALLLLAKLRGQSGVGFDAYRAGERETGAG